MIILLIVNDNDNFICQNFKLYNNSLQDKRLKERLNFYMIIALDYFR